MSNRMSSAYAIALTAIPRHSGIWCRGIRLRCWGIFGVELATKKKPLKPPRRPLCAHTSPCGICIS